MLLSKNRGSRVAFTGLAAAIVSGAALGLVACSSSSSPSAGETDAATDQTAPDSTSEDASPIEAGGNPTGDAADGATGDAGGDADAGSAETGADAGGDGPTNDGATCTPVDASVDGMSADAGSALVQSDFCMNCHGASLSGDVMVMGATSKNLTPDPATGLGCWTDQQIVTAILYGTTPDGETLCVMPQWGTTGFHGIILNATQAEEIVQYLRSIPAVSQVVPPTVCPNTDAGTDGGDAATDAGDAGTD
jgi:hypothetical protein